MLSKYFPSHVFHIKDPNTDMIVIKSNINTGSVL